MEKPVWIVIIVVAVFMGLIIGYSLPPMLEVGMLGGDKDQIGISTDVSDDLADHYKQLTQEPE